MQRQRPKRLWVGGTCAACTPLLSDRRRRVRASHEGPTWRTRRPSASTADTIFGRPSGWDVLDTLECHPDDDIELLYRSRHWGRCDDIRRAEVTCAER